MNDTTDPVTGVPSPDEPSRTRPHPRVRTVVFGLVMLVISVAGLIGLLTDVHVDSGAVGLGILVLAGLALVAGGVSAAVREARTQRTG